MCKFCYKLGEKSHDKTVIWEVRSCMADQNLESENGLVSEWDGKSRYINFEQFRLTAYKNDKEDTMHLSVEYRLETDDELIISPFSETIPIAFCPFCGNKLTGNIVDVEKIYDHKFSIVDEKYDEE